jgi:cysteine desulfuration protein SufE
MIDYRSSMYPAKLNKILNLFESLPEDERRETLVSYADSTKKQEPRESEKFDLIDVRKDEKCTDEDWIARIAEDPEEYFTTPPLPHSITPVLRAHA